MERATFELYVLVACIPLLDLMHLQVDVSILPMVHDHPAWCRTISNVFSQELSCHIQALAYAIGEKVGKSGYLQRSLFAI